MLDKETENKLVNEVKDSDGVRTNTVAFRLKLERQAKEVYSFLCSKVEFWHDRINDLWYYKEERDRKRRAEKARLEQERLRREAEERERERKRKQKQ